MNSKIYVGDVNHTRITPVRHSFGYPVYYYAFDLSELPHLDKSCALFGYNRVRPVSLFSKDYFEPTDTPLLDKTKTFIDTYAPTVGDISSIQLVTAARYFNYVFNPVSFFYCYNNNQSLQCILAYVNNTFGESHIYVLDNPLRNGDPHKEDLRGNPTFTRYQIAKDFHVSPFFDRTGNYDFHFKPPADTLDVHIALVKDKKTVFTAQLKGQAQPFSCTNLLKVMGRYPLTALLTMPQILWEAGKLYFKRRLPVYKKPIATSDFTIRTAPATGFQRWCMNQIIAFSKQLKLGSIELILPDQSRTILGAPQATPRHQIVVRDYRFFSRVLLSGDIGLGESYTNGEWDTDDIPGLVSLFIKNIDSLGQQRFSLSFFTGLYHRFLHRQRKNSVTGSQKNIQTHYDLSNQMYRQFLDETMTYSAAVFQSPEQSLAEAQRNKLQKIIQKARIKSDHHVLEIGSGWGSFAIEAVRQTGCRVTSITISEAQFQLAQERIAQAGLDDKIELKLCDYRSLEGQYDRLVSIEMIEAVGHDYLPEYFKTCQRLLKPNGIMVLQAIIIPDQRYKRYRKDFDWIRKHIFPGGHLPSLQAISNVLTNHTQFVIEDLENIGPHYALTLAQWRQRFLKAEQNIRALGFDQEFCRKWLFYFGFCEAAFSTRYLNDLQLVLTQPRNPDLALWSDDAPIPPIQS